MKKGNRRSFIKYGLTAGAATVAGTSAYVLKKGDKVAGKKVKLLTTDGKLVEVDQSKVQEAPDKPATRIEARKGIPGKKFVMVFIHKRKKFPGTICISICPLQRLECKWQGCALRPI